MGMTEIIDTANKLRRKKDMSRHKKPLQPRGRGWGKEQDHPICNVSRAGPPLAPVAQVGKLRHPGLEISSTVELGVWPQNLTLASRALGRGLAESGAWGGHGLFYILAFLPGRRAPSAPARPSTGHRPLDH